MCTIYIWCWGKKSNRRQHTTATATIISRRLCVFCYSFLFVDFFSVKISDFLRSLPVLGKRFVRRFQTTRKPTENLFRKWLWFGQSERLARTVWFLNITKFPIFKLKEFIFYFQFYLLRIQRSGKNAENDDLVKIIGSFVRDV